MRTFIAIALPQEIKLKIAVLQEELKKSGADAKWVAPENIHLTLKFLGEVNEEKLKKIEQIIEGIAEERLRFPVSISSCGAFPKMESARVLWVGIEKGDKETKEIAKSLEEKIGKLGIPKEERAFSSHITIGRVRSAANCQGLVEGLKKADSVLAGKNLEFITAGITLYKSTLTPQGPVYEALKQALLKTT